MVDVDRFVPQFWGRPLVAALYCPIRVQNGPDPTDVGLFHERQVSLGNVQGELQTQTKARQFNLIDRYNFLTTAMADDELATKAPESDAQESSGIEGDSKPDQGAASMGVSVA